MRLAIAINFCSNEERFLGPCLEALRELGCQIVVAISDHFFDGEQEDLERIRSLSEKFSYAEFVIFPARNDYQPDPGIYSRKVAVDYIGDRADWILFLDVDEIIDADLLKMLLASGDLNGLDSIKLANYYYFRQPIYRALSLEDSAVLVRRQHAVFQPGLQIGDRSQVHELIDCRKQRAVTVGDKAVVHHFSWVRSRVEMLRKVKTWGHKHDRDWVTLVEEEFSREFSGTCFVHGYQYEIVEDRFAIGLVA